MLTITSTWFVFLLLFIIVVYYSVPCRYQWITLLVSSLVIYFIWNRYAIVYILISSMTTYWSTKLITRGQNSAKSNIANNKDILSKDDIAKIKITVNKRNKVCLVIGLTINFGFLFFFKYFSFLLHNICYAIGELPIIEYADTFWGEVVIPLGISFYTFQLVGYLLDVYWGYYDYEKNYFRLLLFASFFPQITQGPISSYELLSAELFAEHHFSYDCYARGMWRLMWGLAKKMVIADSLSPIVTDIFHNYSTYSGLTVCVGAFLYTIQIYMDFSGYMDIMCGFCKTLGISLTENFDTPYFSKSIAEYWRRWHISLGEWFKKYIYYPVATSKNSRKLSRLLSRWFDRNIVNNIPATLALIVTWLATGLWHGASWAYIVWGGVNGLFIIFALWLEPSAIRLRGVLKIKSDNIFWSIVAMIRTFILVTLIKVFPEVGDLKDGLLYWKRIFYGSYSIEALHELRSVVSFEISFAKFIIPVLLVIVFFCSYLKYNGKMTDIKLEKFNILFRVATMIILILIIVIVGIPASSESVFMYARF